MKQEKKHLVLSFAVFGPNEEEVKKHALWMLSRYLWADDDIEIVSVHRLGGFGDKAWVAHARILTFGTRYQILKDVKVLQREYNIWLQDKPHVYKAKEERGG